MNDRYFTDWESMTDAVNKKAAKILKEDVSPIAERILKKHIKTDIYDVYTPKEHGWVGGTTYQRRHVLENSVKSIYQNPNVLIVTSTATASPSVVKGYSFRNRYPGAFLKLLESGNMGIWRGGFPRPAVKNTQAEIDTSSDISRAIKNGIIREIGGYEDV